MARRIFLICVIVGSLFFAPHLEADNYQVGAAKVDITPAYPIRMNGFLVRKQESIGVRIPVFAKALAIGSDAEGPAVLITVDTLGIPADITAEVARRLHAKANLRPDRLAITASHSHTAPMINGCAPNIFGEPIPAEHQAHIDQYTREFIDHLEQVALAALADRRESQLAWGVGVVTFAKNRRDKNGPYDHDLPMLVVRSLSGEVRAIYVSYACHCVTLSEPRLGGDWAGYAQQQIEKRFPQAIAMTSIGCAGDQNPTTDVMNDRFDMALGQGEQIAQEVDRLLAGKLRPVTGPLVSKSQEIDLPLITLPTREEFAKLAEQKTPIGYHARVQLNKLDRGEKLREKVSYPISTWAFGDSLAMVFLAGEVVSEYGLRIKTELDGRRMWINAYANAAPCYIPSEKVLKVGGYEGGGAMIYYDQPTRFAPGLEAPIIDTVKQQLLERFPPELAPGTGQGTRPRAPEQSLRMLKVAGGLQVDLVAAEPLVTSPVAVDFGPDGKVWLAEMFDYPSGIHGDFGPGGRVRLLSSSRADGQLDQATVFLDGIPFPTGITVWRKGVLICAAPDILYAEDTNADGRADIVKKLYSGFGTDNFQARVNSLEVGLDGWVYGSCGLFGGSIKSFASDKPFELGDRDFRIQPDTGAIEPASGRTQQGRVRDDYGNWFGCSNQDLGFHYPLAAHYDARNRLAPPPPGASHVPASPEDDRLIPGNSQLQLFKLSGDSGIATAACGIGIYRDSVLGKNYSGDLFTCEPVNLLVHRLKLSPQGSTIVGRRPAEEATQEFLSSSDTWFRPVQARTAPDGSLWVLDMYRYVIEHPRWIPPDSLAQIDPRAGASMGRIYRIRPAGDAKLVWPKLSELKPIELVAALDSASGWQRDMVMQLLVWNKQDVDKPAVQALREQALHSSRPETRLQALATLAQLTTVSAEECLTLLEDAHPAVRRLAVQLSESFASRRDNTADTIGVKLTSLVDDKDAGVRLQLAYSLGAWPEAAVAAPLAQLILASPNDRYLQAAVVSSLKPKMIVDFTAVLSSESGAEPLGLGQHSTAVSITQPMAKIFPLAMRMVPLDDSLTLLNIGVEHAMRTTESTTWQTLADMLDRAEKRPDMKPVLAEFWKNDNGLPDLLSAAGEAIIDEQSPVGLRVAGIALISHSGSGLQSSEVDLLLGVLTPRQPSAIQTAAVEALLRGGNSEVASQLVSSWKQFSPQLKNNVLDGLLSRDAWVKVVLDAVDNKSIDAVEIDATRRQRLLDHRDSELRARAEKLLAGKLNSDRVAVLESYASVSQMTGDMKRGEELFRKNCGTCHKLGEIGSSVGPDLTALASKPVAFFLQEILDPNRNLDSRYMSYTALTDSGRSMTGLLAAETASAITLRGAEAKEESLLRSELESLSSTRASLMPEGLERLLKPQDLADVIHFVRANAQEAIVPEKMAAGELARDILSEAMPEPDRMRLIPVAAKTAAEVITAMAANLPNNEKEEYRRIPWIWRVAVAAGKEGDTLTLKKTIEISLPRKDQPLRDWQAVVIGGGVINGLGLRGDWPMQRIDEMLHGDEKLSTRWKELLAASVAMADNTNVRKGTRYDALRIAALQAWPAPREQLLRYLGKEVDPELQMGSVSGLADIDHPEASRLLIDNLAEYAPVNRKLAIVALAHGPARQELLLSALEAGRVKPSEIEAAERKKLLESSSATIAARARSIGLRSVLPE